MSVCVFISSSDNTRDVFERVAPSFALHWPDCPYPQYVGLNTRPGDSPYMGFSPICAPVNGWRQELLTQVSLLKEDYVILFLDDFLLLDRVDTQGVDHLVDLAKNLGLAYLRFTPVSRALLPRLIHLLKFDRREIEIIPETMPYYSSLQVAIWNRHHLMKLLASDVGDIWAFEHQRLPDRTHYAVRRRGPIPYIHVVERGRWLPFAVKLFRRSGLAFDQGARPCRPRTDGYVWWMNHAKFLIVGYAVMRWKKQRRSKASPE